MNDHSGSESSWSAYLILAVLSLSLCGNVWLGWKLRSASTQSSTVSIEKETGQVIGSLPVQDINERDLALDLRRDSYVLYIFDPQCQWCKKNRANLGVLFRERSSKYKFIGISRTSRGLSEYLRGNQIPFPVYVVTSQDALKRLDFVGTPQTLVLDNGKVIHNWAGAYDERILQSVDSFFAVNLPGIDSSIN